MEKGAAGGMVTAVLGTLALLVMLLLLMSVAGRLLGVRLAGPRGLMATILGLLAGMSFTLTVAAHNPQRSCTVLLRGAFPRGAKGGVGEQEHLLVHR
jgi:hypothetical protein